MSENLQPATKTLKVTGIVRESSDTKTFILQPEDHTLLYKPGQFLTLITRSVTGKHIRRSYSISSSPDIGEPLAITVKRISNGEFSRFLFDKVIPGNTLETIGASGFFVLPEKLDNYDTVIFFAAGSGITPVYSLIKTVLHNHRAIKVLLVYSNRSAADTIFSDGLQRLLQKFAGKFSIQFFFSNSADLIVSRLTPASIENILGRDSGQNNKWLFYVCGPSDYMRMVTYNLQSLGVSAARIKREIFFAQQPAVAPLPPDTKPHLVKVISGKGEYQVTVQHPVTILHAAKMANIDIPFSCELGQCGSCVAKCLQGEVWMARNEVLLEEEIKNGMILTCTGYPVHGDVTISI